MNISFWWLFLGAVVLAPDGSVAQSGPVPMRNQAETTPPGQIINSEWDEKWEVKTQITDWGWSAEISIPFKSLRFVNEDSMIWGVNFHRTIKRKNEDVFWTNHDRNYRFEEVSRAGHLIGLSEIQAFTFRIKPYFTSGASKALTGGAHETRHLTDIGIEDAKYVGAMFVRNTAGLARSSNQAGGVDGSFTLFQHLNLRGATRSATRTACHAACHAEIEGLRGAVKG